jgi:hypothetical protein
MPVCRGTYPVFEEKKAGHQVACHLY